MKKMYLSMTFLIAITSYATGSSWTNYVDNQTSDDIYFGGRDVNFTDDFKVKANSKRDFDWPTPSDRIQFIYGNNKEKLYATVDGNDTGVGFVTLVSYQSGKPDRILKCYKVKVDNFIGNYGYNIVYRKDKTIFNNFDGVRGGPTEIKPQDSGYLTCETNFNQVRDHP